VLLEERDRPSEGLARRRERLHLQEAVRHSLAHNVFMGDAALFERGSKRPRLRIRILLISTALAQQLTTAPQRILEMDIAVVYQRFSWGEGEQSEA